MHHHTPPAMTLALTVLFAAAPVTAQDRSVGDDLGDAGRDILHVWSAPFRVSTKDLEGVAVVTALFASTLPLDRTIQNWLEAHPHSLPLRLLGPFRESSPLNLIGRTKVLLPTSVALYAAGLAFDSEELRDAGMGCVVSNVSTTLSRTLLNRIVGRQRPEVGGGPYVFRPFTFDEWDVRSFPGGHAANIMSCVSYWNHRFDLGVAEPLLYLVAGSVGAARTADRAHWTSDTVVGMAFGFAVGKAIA
ncbi:MAG: phosphatase PAP2 family protein, partial [Longimicrobiales bacterium]